MSNICPRPITMICEHIFGDFKKPEWYICKICNIDIRNGNITKEKNDNRI